MADVKRDYILTRSVRIGALEIDDIKYPQFIIRGNPGNLRNASTGALVDVPAADVVHALVGIRAKPTEQDLSISTQLASVIADTNDKFEWFLYIDPTVAGIFTYNDLPNSRVQVAIANTDNTISGGIRAVSGYGEGNAAIQAQIESEFALGAEGAEIVLAVRSFSNQADFEGSLVWRELL